MTRLTVILVLATLSACGGTTTTASNPSPSPLSGGCTSSGNASVDWTVPQVASNSTPTIVSATANGDTLQLTFVKGTPQFQVVPQSSAHFVTDPKGAPVDLAGSAGARIALTGFRGDMSNYSGPTTLTSSGPLLLQVAAIGDFEGYVSWGVGLSEPGCAKVISSGSTLTLHFIKAPAQ